MAGNTLPYTQSHHKYQPLLGDTLESSPNRIPSLPHPRKSHSRGSQVSRMDALLLFQVWKWLLAKATDRPATRGSHCSQGQADQNPDYHSQNTHNPYIHMCTHPHRRHSCTPGLRISINPCKNQPRDGHWSYSGCCGEISSWSLRQPWCLSHRKWRHSSVHWCWHGNDLHIYKYK